MLRAINFTRLFLLIVIFIVLAMVTGFITGADEETGFQDSGAIIVSLVFIAKWTFILIELPVILLDFRGIQTFTAYFAIIIFDCILYSVIIEIALGKYKRYRLRKNLQSYGLSSTDPSCGVPK